MTRLRTKTRSGKRRKSMNWSGRVVEDDDDEKERGYEEEQKESKRKRERGSITRSRSGNQEEVEEKEREGDKAVVGGEAIVVFSRLVTNRRPHSPLRLRTSHSLPGHNTGHCED